MRRPLFILSGILTACINNDPDRFVISHVNVIAMDDDQLRRDYSVVIQDGRIRELGPAASVSVPRGFGEVPGAGRYLLPSLVDTHAHVCDAGDLTTYLAYGVGAIRNMRGTPFHLHLRSAVAASTSSAKFASGVISASAGRSTAIVRITAASASQSVQCDTWPASSSESSVSRAPSFGI